MVDGIKQFVSDAVENHFQQQNDYMVRLAQKEVNDIKNYIGEHNQMVERDRANLQQNIYAINQHLEELMNKVDALQTSIDCLVKAQIIENDHNESSTISSQQDVLVYYAKMVDSTNPLGFKLENLKKTKEGCAFKIVINNDNGYYECIDDAEIQHELLAAFNPLISDSSVYSEIPHNATRINVVERGTVIKDNDMLRISKKQLLEFE